MVLTQEVKDPWVMVLPRVMILPLQKVSVLLSGEEMNGWEMRTEVSVDISSRCNHNETLTTRPVIPSCPREKTRGLFLLVANWVWSWLSLTAAYMITCIYDPINSTTLIV